MERPPVDEEDEGFVIFDRSALSASDFPEPPPAAFDDTSSHEGHLNTPSSSTDLGEDRAAAAAAEASPDAASGLNGSAEDDECHDASHDTLAPFLQRRCEKVEAQLEEALQAKLGIEEQLAAEKRRAEDEKKRADAAEATLAIERSRADDAEAALVAVRRELQELRNQHDVAQMAHQQSVKEMDQEHEQDLSRIREGCSDLMRVLKPMDGDLLGPRMSADDDPAACATAIHQQLIEAQAAARGVQDRDQRKIALDRFGVGECVLFFPFSRKGQAQKDPAFVNYLAFNTNKKIPRHFLADESKALVDMGSSTCNSKFVIGMVVEKESRTATSADCAKYDISIGTRFFVVRVQAVDYWG